MKFYKLMPNAGSHVMGAGSQYRVLTVADNAVINSEVDLAKLFPNKFEQIGIPETTQEATEDGSGLTQKPDTTLPSTEVKDSVVLGKDITKQLSIARKNAFKVFQNGDVYYVVEADDVDTPLHPEPLKKKEVVPFIEKYLKG